MFVRVSQYWYDGFDFLNLYHDQAQVERVAREAMPRMLAPLDARIGGTVPKLRIPAGMKWWREPLLGINHFPSLLSVTVFGKTSWSTRNVGYGSHGHESGWVPDDARCTVWTDDDPHENWIWLQEAHSWLHRIIGHPLEPTKHNIIEVFLLITAGW